jgi:hypothetical protein
MRSRAKQMTYSVEMSSPKLNSNKNGYVTSKSKIIAFKKTGDISEDPLTELLRTGARQLICCLLQIGYFKAKQTFFSLFIGRRTAGGSRVCIATLFQWDGVCNKPVSQYEYYAQRNEITRLFGYCLWAETDRQAFVSQATQLAKRVVSPTFILTELLSYLETEKIVRPG